MTHITRSQLVVLPVTLALLVTMAVPTSAKVPSADIDSGDLLAWIVDASDRPSLIAGGSVYDSQVPAAARSASSSLYDEQVPAAGR